MSAITLSFCVALSLLMPASWATPAPETTTQVQIKNERRIRFTTDWRFFKGEAAGAEAPEFNDSAWRALDLPHDWAIEGPFDKKNDPNTGGLPISGTGWYRKHFTLREIVKDRHFSIEFDGAMSNAHVWLNGKEIGSRPYGYASFAFDLTPNLRWDGENVLAVRLTPEPQSSRWYPGAGIYRNVWLTVTGPVHVAHWGTYITTPEVSAARATVAIATEIQNDGAAAAAVQVVTTIRDAGGREVAHDSHGSEGLELNGTFSAKSNSGVDLPAGAKQSIEQKLEVSNPHRWDMDDPYLYSAVTEIKQGGKVVDRYVTPFGIRTLEFSREKGFLLNGRYRKLNGVCNHHDLGALGAAVNRRATERQLQIMKSMGVNAIRTSHNPPSPELLELCDRMGLVVMDESFDMWRIPKVKNGLSKFFDEWYERDLRDLIRRDRNHPSVIFWSIGNEIPEQGKADGGILAKRLTDICHEEDRTRPTTSAFDNPDGAIKNELAANVDVPGFNYKPTRYAELQAAHPKWAVYGSETESCVSSRGVYHLPMKLEGRTPDLQVSSNDIEAPPWAYCPDVEFEFQKTIPNLLGEFVWTGFDYLGEPTPYGSRNDWPSRSSYFGIVDLAGFPKDRFYSYKSFWTTEPTVHVFPHWNWAGHEGEKIPVMVYTNAQEVELFLNGKSLGRKKLGVDTFEMPVGKNVSKDGKFTSKFRLMWEVPYAPGELKAVGYRDGKEFAVDAVKTAGAPARVVLSPDRKAIGADGEDLSFVTVRVEDKDGNFCPLADNLVKFKLDGPATIAGVDNGNAASVEPFQADYRKAFNGLALVIVRSQNGKPGRIRLTASSDSLQAGETRIDSAK
jgi:beta-galactosidase